MARQTATSVWSMALRIVLAAALIGGCSGDCRRRGAARYRIALIMKSLANEFFKTMEDGARAHQQKHKARYELLPHGIKDERDVKRQIEIVEQMIADRVDAIVLAPADSKLLVPTCKKALDAGIVVVNIDNKLDAQVLAEEGISIPFVGPDNRKGAKKAGDYLARTLKAGDRVLIVEGIPAAFNAAQRKLGFRDAMAAAKIVVADSQSAHWEADKAERLVSNMIQQHRETKAILCANDSMALGAVAALRAAGKLGQVFVVGFDNISPVQELIREGKVLCTIDQHADQIAVYGIQHALRILDGELRPADYETPVDLITAKELR